MTQRKCSDGFGGKGGGAPPRLRFYATFALRTFYDLAILRRKPGPIRRP